MTITTEKNPIPRCFLHTQFNLSFLPSSQNDQKYSRDNYLIFQRNSHERGRLEKSSHADPQSHSAKKAKKVMYDWNHECRRETDRHSCYLNFRKYVCVKLTKIRVYIYPPAQSIRHTGPDLDREMQHMGRRKFFPANVFADLTLYLTFCVLRRGNTAFIGITTSLPN